MTDPQLALKDFKGSAAVVQGEAFDPSPANIEKRLTRSSLPNGMKLALLSKKTRGATVHGTITLRYSDLENSKNRNRAAQPSPAIDADERDEKAHPAADSG